MESRHTISGDGLLRCVTAFGGPLLAITKFIVENFLSTKTTVIASEPQASAAIHLLLLPKESLSATSDDGLLHSLRSFAMTKLIVENPLSTKTTVNRE